MPEKLPKRVSKLPYPWIFRSVFMGIGLTLATAAIYLSWASQPLKRAKVGEIVGIAEPHFVSINGQPGKPGDEVVVGQQITTSQNSKVVLQQVDQVLARLGISSSAILENECIQLSEGQIVISSTQGCLGATITQSLTEKGAIYVLERLGTVGQIKVLAGQVEVALPSNRVVQSITLTSNQKITFSLTGDDVGPVRLMLPSEVESILKGELFQGFQQPLTNQTLIAGLSEEAPPKASTVPEPIPPIGKSQPSAQPVKPAVAATPSSPAAESTVHSVSTPEPAIQYEELQDDRSTEKMASYQTPYLRSPRHRRVPESAYDQPTYHRKRARSSYLTGAYRRRSPSYSSPSYSPSYSPPSYSPPSYSPPSYSPPKEIQPAPEISQPTEAPAPVPAPVMELPPADLPMEPAPVLEPSPPSVVVETSIETHP